MEESETVCKCLQETSNGLSFKKRRERRRRKRVSDTLVPAWD